MARLKVTIRTGIAGILIAVTMLIGAVLLGFGVFEWRSDDLARFLCYIVLAMLGSGLNVSLPSLAGTVSVTFVFIMIGLSEMTLPETLVLGCLATFTENFVNAPGRKELWRAVVNSANCAIAITVAHVVCDLHPLMGQTRHSPVILVAGAISIFAVTSLLGSICFGLQEGTGVLNLWRRVHLWSFPYYIVGAAIAGFYCAANREVGWKVSMLVIPVLYLVYRSYRLYVHRLDDERLHAAEVADLHLRTIEALALAIEAKDTTTHDHLQRVQIYATEIGKELGISREEMEALRAAALLHDIGKLAVPEHIISKPGKLTPEEFEKMKIHPVVGAELLERVQFPYPVVPIVRSHHEKWDGTGYPDGLAGTEIPIGARILSAVDCLDALASDRQYRKALPLDEAMSRVEALSGTTFDPQVVEVLKRRYVELERKAQNSKPIDQTRLSTEIRIERGAAPAAGFAEVAPAAMAIPPPRADAPTFLASIAAARDEAQTLFELTQNLGSSLSLDETLSVLAVRLKKMIPFDSLAIYVRHNDDKLVPQYVSGENYKLFSSLEIPVGQGLSGWVVDNKKPIINGNPSVEPGYLNDSTKFSTLRSALAVPLEGATGVVGSLTLYAAGRDAFSRDHLRILLAICSKVAISIENALKYQQAETGATTDYLTGLPNARSLFLHLDSEVARCLHSGTPLSVLVCDLNGFKQINDRYGHLEGNKVLKTVAKHLREGCREYDYVARMGGDEFVIVLPGLPADAVKAKMQHFTSVTAGAGKDLVGEQMLSISIGEAHFPEDGSDAEQLLAEADRRMYKFKSDMKAGLERLQVERDMAADLNKLSSLGGTITATTGR